MYYFSTIINHITNSYNDYPYPFKVKNLLTQSYTYEKYA